MFGVTRKGRSVHVKVEGFKPYCYVRPNRDFRKKQMESFRTFVERSMRKHASSIVGFDLVKKTCLMGYQEPCNFVKITFHTKKAMNYLKYIFLESNQTTDEDDDVHYYYTKKMIKIPGVNQKPFYYKLYESNIDPIIRFIHNTNINACGWISIPKRTYRVEEPAVSSARTQISLITTMDNVHRLECDEIAPLSVLSFDLECTSIDGGFPQASRPGDKIIQCGFTMHVVGKDNSTPFKYINTLGTCDDIDGVIVRSFETEEELLKDICNVISRIDPDIVTGYNIYGFDFRYLRDRCSLYNLDLLPSLSRLKSNPADVQYKKLESSALGFNEMYILNMDGRVTMDLYKIFQSNFKLTSYKLDNVAKKYLDMQKNDVSPADIFRLQEGTSEDRATVAKYCIQDCLLVNLLMDKLCFLSNNIGMANVCSVPLIYLFLKGQGVKGLSLVSKFCQNKDYVVPMLLKNNQFLKWKDMTTEQRDDMKKYTGAVVLKANKGLHYYPVVVNDFGSLYPSCMISHNLSPDTLITKNSPDIPEDMKEHRKWTEKNGTEFHYVFKKASPEEEKWKKENWPEFKSEQEERDWVGGYNDYQANKRTGRGIIPQIEIYLLASRKNAKKLKARAIAENNTFMANVYDGLQLAYKLCGNSLYGLLGAQKGDLFCKPVAASITATGRELLTFSMEVTQELYPDSETIYGDTDSIMVRYPLKGYVPNTKYTTDDEKEYFNIQARDCGLHVEREVSKRLPYPHVLEMEKIFFPFFLLSKKRYAAIQYDSDMRKHSKVNYSGIAMTRRDNAPILKHVLGGALDILLFQHDTPKSVQFIQDECRKLLNGELRLEDLQISVTLKKVKKQKQGQHILAERMAIRDPGNAPQLNDRILYVFIKLAKKQERLILALQNTADNSKAFNTSTRKNTKPKVKTSIDVGYKIETPQFIRDNPDVNVDYYHYLTNQILKPICDLYKTVFTDPEKHIFFELMNNYNLKSNNMRQITDFF